MSCCSIELSLKNAIIAVALYYIVPWVFSRFQKWQNGKKMEKWNNAPRGKVILHGIPRGRTVPSISPFVLKLETYLRMAKIPYEIDTTDPFGPKGKTPWITYNGQHVADSEFCIDFLKTKFDKIPDKYSKAEKSAGRAHRIVLETQFLLGLGKWRWVDNVHMLPQIHTFPYHERILYGILIGRQMKTNAWYQGLGRHSDEDYYRITSDDLRSVSDFIGTKKFLLGDEPSDGDSSVFGMLAMALWASQGSPFERLLNGELSNLKEYCIRMRDRYWPDWDQCLDK